MLTKTSASSEPTDRQAASKNTTSAADAVGLTTAKTASSIIGGGETTGGMGGDANAAKTSASSAPPSSSSPSSSSAEGRKADAADASGVGKTGQDRELAPPSPPRSARVGKGRGQGKRKGICARPPWSRQGAVARLVYEKTTGRTPANKGQSGGDDKSSGDTNTDTGSGDNSGCGSGDDSGGASDPGVLPSDGRGEESGDTSRREDCMEEDREHDSGTPPTSKECSFWAPCGSADKV